MYKKIINQIISQINEEDTFLLDELTNGYSEEFEKCKSKRKYVKITDRLVKSIENCCYTPSPDNDAFFKHFIINLILCRFPVYCPKRFFQILTETRNIKYFKNLLGLSFDLNNLNISVFTGELSRFFKYENLDLKQQKNFISLLKMINLEDSRICDYITFFYLLNLNYGIKYHKLPKFMHRYSDRIFIHFVDECNDQSNTPLIHDLFGSDIITIEYNGKIYRIPYGGKRLNKDTLLDLFISRFPDYIGVIRIWITFEDYFTETVRFFHIINFSDLDPDEFNSLSY